MISRCHNPAKDNFKYYGGRGISVCERWRSVEVFIADVSSGYVEGYTLDRIDNQKGYGPDNVRWVPFAQQGRNKRNNVWLNTPLGVLLLADALLLWTEAECRKFERVEHG